MKPTSRKNSIIVQDTNEEILIYDLLTNKAYILNETSVFVWQMCDGTKDVSAISKALAKKTKQPEYEDIVWLALYQLNKANLLEKSEISLHKFEGANRREVIKKIGFASMIALPIVSSLITPTATHAASCSGSRNITPNGTTTVSICLSNSGPFPTPLVLALKGNCASCLYRNFVNGASCPTGNRGSGTCCPPSGGTGCQ